MENMRLLSDLNFREIDHHFIYIECRAILEDLMPEDINDNDTGLCAYGYIDENAGLSLQPFGLGSDKGDMIEIRVLPDPIKKYVLRYHGKYMKKAFVGEEEILIMATIPAPELKCVDLEEIGAAIGRYKEFGRGVCAQYDLTDKEKAKLRDAEKYGYMDKFRHPCFPDEVSVILYNGRNDAERVWVRCCFEAEGEVFGILLDEPKSNYTIHRGQMIGFLPVGQGEEMYLSATGHTAKTITE